MVKIIQGFRQPNPIAQGIRNAAHSLFGDRLTPALKQAQLEAAHQKMAIEDAERRNLESYAGSLPADMQGAVLGGVSGTDLGKYNLLNTARGVAEGGGDLLGRDVSAAQLGAGLAAGSSGLGFREGEANQTARSRYSADASAGATIQSARIRAAQAAQAAQDRLAWERDRFGMEPETVIDPQGNPVLRPRSLAMSGAHGFTAPISLDERKSAYIGPRMAESGGLGNLPLEERTMLGAAPSATQAEGDLMRQHFGSVDALSPRQAEMVGALPSETDVRGDVLSQAIAGRGGLPLANIDDETLLESVGLGRPKREVSRWRTADGRSYVSTDRGLTDINTGEQIPPDAVEMGAVKPTDLQGAGLTTATQSALQAESGALRRARDTIDLARSVAADPSIFGAGGLIRRAGQGVSNVVKTLDAAVGGNGFTQTAQRIEREMQDPTAVDPSARPAVFSLIYDPNLDSVDTIHGMLVYQLASALAGQEGRGLSDRDLQRVLQAFPSPDGLFTSQEAFINQLNVAEQMLGLRQRANVEERQGAGGGGGPQPGTIEDGYRFVGGDPADPSSWEPVQ